MEDLLKKIVKQNAEIIEALNTIRYNTYNTSKNTLDINSLLKHNNISKDAEELLK